MRPLAGYAHYTRRALARRATDIEQYRDRIGRVVRDGDRILHLGCGWDHHQVTSGLRERAEVIGVDLDRSVGTRYHSPFWWADAANLPFGQGTIDLVCSENVFEHIERPMAVMAELDRVVRPGGTVVALTPNRWSYKSLAAAATPDWFHRIAAAHLRADARATEGVYPTRYRMNSPSTLRRLAAAHGFRVDELILLNNGPTWFTRIPGLFEVGRVYHRILDFDRLAGLRCAILVTLRRRDAQGGAAEPSVARSKLVIRCTACGADGMHATDDFFVCGHCGARYRREGNMIDTLGS